MKIEFDYELTTVEKKDFEYALKQGVLGAQSVEELCTLVCNANMESKLTEWHQARMAEAYKQALAQVDKEDNS